MISKDLLTAISNITEGRPVDAQIDNLLEAGSIKGWWPAPGSQHGRPQSDDFWAKVMVTVLRKKEDGDSSAAAMFAAAKKHKITTSFLHTFLDKTGLLNAFRGCTLDALMTARAFNGAALGKGIWTAGTEQNVVGQDNFMKSTDPQLAASDPDVPVYKPTKSMYKIKNPKDKNKNTRPKSNRAPRRFKSGGGNWWTNRSKN